ncbi:ecdysone 20-monooxygenase [Tetranychus urticae]|uniref:Cytochrome P450 n=1 Tax=Tetranychus urticae TaxID=32264 RepID=T1JZ83_TETUR|nr:ecdysone 20-monooxygenase [Tetranychus urticae]
MIGTKLKQVISQYFSRLSIFKLHEALEAKHSRYGSIKIEKRYWPIKRTIVYVFNPADIEKILRAQGKCPYRPANEFLVKYRKSRPDRYPTVGFSNLQGEDWFSQRLLIAPVLLSNSIANVYTPQLNIIVNDFVNYLQHQSQQKDGIIEDLLKCTDQFALESIALISLNTRLGCLSTGGSSEDAKRLIAADKSLFEAFQVLYHGIPWWKFWPTPSYRKFVSAEDEIYNISSKYVDSAFDDLVSSKTLNSTDPDGTSLGKNQDDDSSSLMKTLLKTKGLEKAHLKTLAIDFMVGGVNTVSSSLCFLLYHLAQNPLHQEKLFSELDKVIGDPNVDMNEKHLSQLPYLKACLKESFRLTTVIPNLVRVLPEPITLSGQTIPAGVPIMLNFGVICKHADYFENPELFKPERWIGEARRSIHPFSLLTFGLGNRMCAGRRISEIELYLAAAKIILKYRLISKTPDLKLKQDFIIVPENKIKVALEIR